MLSETEQAKFTALWTEVQPSVSHYILSVVREPAAAKDLVQSTALVLLKKIPDYQEDRPFLSWALGIAKFEILGHRRDEARSLVRFDSALLDRYTETWAEACPNYSHEIFFRILSPCSQRPL